MSLMGVFLVLLVVVLVGVWGAFSTFVGGLNWVAGWLWLVFD